MRRALPPVWCALALLVAAALVPSGKSDARARFAASAPEKGRLLVARPGMVDPNFAETVVLLLEFGDNGAMGVIVNRPTRVMLSEVLPEVGWLAERPEVVFSGGPVGVNRLIFTFRGSSLPADCHAVLADVCATGSLEALEEALDGDERAVEFRGYAGHAGWAPGQLEWEIQEDGWYVLAGDSRRIFDGPPEELWSDLVQVAEGPVA